MRLGQTGFTAYVGYSVYQDEPNTEPDFYTIAVQKSHQTNTSLVYYERQFTITELPPGFIHEPITNIVSYDEVSRVVTFLIGNKKYEYQLPDEQ